MPKFDPATGTYSLKFQDEEYQRPGTRTPAAPARMGNRVEQARSENASLQAAIKKRQATLDTLRREIEALKTARGELAKDVGKMREESLTLGYRVEQLRRAEAELGPSLAEMRETLDQVQDSLTRTPAALGQVAEAIAVFTELAIRLPYRHRQAPPEWQAAPTTLPRRPASPAEAALARRLAPPAQ